MKHSVYTILAIASVCFTVSCSSVEKDKTGSETISAYEKTEKENENNEAILAKRNRVINGWDTTRYTYEIQEIFRDNKDKRIMLKGSVQDIVSKDGKVFIQIKGDTPSYPADFSAQLTIDSADANRFIDKLKKEDNGGEGAFVFIPQIRGVHYLNIGAEPDVTGHISDEEYDNIDADITIDTHRYVIYLEGDLIDFYLDKSGN